MIYYVIIGKDKVYGTYDKTICATVPFANEEEKEEASTTVKAIVFNYAERQLNVTLRIATDEKILGSGDVFNFLHKNIQQ